MSLKAFHVFFIALSVLVAALFGAWGIVQYRHTGDVGALSMGAGSSVASAGLVVYLRSFLRKWKRVSYL